MGWGLFKGPPRAPPPALRRPPPTSWPRLRQFLTSLDDEVTSPLPIGCAWPSVTGSPAAVLTSLKPLPSSLFPKPAGPGLPETADWPAPPSLLQRAAWKAEGGRGGRVRSFRGREEPAAAVSVVAVAAARTTVPFSPPPQLRLPHALRSRRLLRSSERPGWTLRLGKRRAL